MIGHQAVPRMHLATSNFCEYFGKASFRKVLKEALLWLKTIRGKHLIHKLFDALCEEKLERALVMRLYLKTRFSSIDIVLARFKKTRSFLTHLSLSIVTDEDRLSIDPIIDMPPEIVSLMSGKKF